MSKNKLENEKLIAGLAYILVGIIWYFIDDKIKQSDFTKFHVKQALNLIIFSILINTSIQILNFITFKIFTIIEWIIEIIFLILFIVAIVNVINYEKKPVLIIGEIANNYLKF